MAFAYPSNFLRTFWRVIDGDIYVSHLGSDLSGNGSPRKPYKTIQHAVNVASAANKIVIGTGNYSEAVNGLAKNCRLVADATVLLKGASSDTAFTNMGSNSTIEGFNISNYAAAVNGVVSGLLSCFIQSPLTNFGGAIKKTILLNIAVNATATVRFINCTLIGVLSSSSGFITRLESCHFGSASNIQTSTPTLSYFDYCNQQPGSVIQINGTPFANHTLVNVSHPGFQIHGKSVSPQFNQPLIGDYTLAATSPIKNAGRSSTPIGALGEAVKLGIPQILSGGSLSGITITPEGFAELPPGIVSGTVTTPVADLGSIRPVRTIHLYADQVFDEAVFRLVSFNETSFLPGAITVEMRYSDDLSDIETAGYQPMIWDLSPTHDKTFAGNGSISFNVIDSTFITTRYVQFRITLRNGADVTLLAQENNNLLLQEDERAISV